jgi:abhydrolase domain-containing protein 6
MQRFLSIFIPLIFISIILSGCVKMEDAIVKTIMDWEISASGLTQKKVNVDGIDFVYFEGGQGAETIVLLHGFAADKSNWIRFARTIVSEYKVIIPDQAGHGESGGTLKDSYTIPIQADRLAQFTRKIGVDKFHLVGNSMGGEIAFFFTFQHPGRVKSLGLFDSAGVISPEPSEFSKLLAKGENPLIANSAENYERLLDFAMEDPPFLPWPFAKVMSRKSSARKELNEKIFSDIMKPGKYTAQQVLSAIKTPVLILWGKEDRVIHVSSVSVFERYLSNQKNIVLENVGHAPMVERPEETANIIKDFIKDQL